MSAYCPCKNCSLRSAECHSLCRAYREWRKGMDEERDLRIIQSKTEDYFNKPKHKRHRKENK